MTPHEINILIERYLDGETTPAEERALALAVQREDRPAEWAIIAEMLGELTLDEAIYDEIMAQRAPKPAKRLTKLWPWAAAACVAIAFVLSYNILKEEPHEIAKMQQPQAPTKAQQVPEKAQQQAPEKGQQPLLATATAPSEPVLSCDASHDTVLASIDSTPASAGKAPKETSLFEASVDAPLSEAQADAPLPEPQPQLIAEVEEPFPSEDLALCMALLAEVEARTIELQQQSNRPELSL